MRAAVVRRFGGPEVLEIASIDVPEIRDHQLLVRVEAAAVNRIDLSTRSGALAEAGLMRPAPVVGLGWDAAGTVEAAGAAVTRFAVGDRVIGLRDRLSAGGAQAEFVALDETALAPAPRSVPAAEASTLPLIGLTADLALRRTGLRAGQTLLVTGAAGGVGGLALELAALRGVRTVADDKSAAATWTVPRGEPAQVRDLVPGGVDAVIDAAVLGVEAHEALRGGGTFVTLVRPFAPPPLRDTRVVVAEVAADGARLTELAALVDAGHLTLGVAATFPLDAVAEAHERLAAGGLRGRLVLTPGVRAARSVNFL
ncbi:NADP-dependent oxidoreductase [Actinoplanes sp. TRM 88003]|uniref:NADP-dependent oxidoreductase n=1 Tax=Paractinoplanes aksuensis TaxID=2939490 RepID=A0ABT1DWT9_9ACTN|nr:NADP-dependent oxidoreductase [Actinoplanes aksuensis]MCO8275023.1 NADP-dependent oxidoreductase [Actinoplanes aksuensis]